MDQNNKMSHNLSNNGYWAYFDKLDKNQKEGKWMWVPSVAISPRYDMTPYMKVKKMK